VRANRLYEIEESGAREFTASPKSEPQTLFEDVSGLLGHVHRESDFNDFERQPGLPRKLSQLGPGVAWADMDGDGWDDLIIGSGKGGRLAIFRNDTQGGFKPMTGGWLDQTVTRDETGVVVCREDSKSVHVLVGSANYEEGKAVPSSVQRWDSSANTILEDFTNFDSSIGPLALTDMDGDGNLDLFVGGRVIGGRYPEAASSQIYRRVKGAWQLDQENSRLLEKVGLVSGAVWSDLDGDGFPELILACEWGPVRIFHNDHGRLVSWDAPVSATNSQLSTINQFSGWWNGVTTGDLAGNGRMDIIASNYGLNTPYRASADHPAILYYGEFSGRGTLDLIETDYDPALKAIVPRRMRERVAEAIPDVLGRFPTHRAFSLASMDQILGPHQAAARAVRATTLASMVFLNRTNAFEAQLLPEEVQFAPAFSVNVGDFDGDGCEDIFLSQNFFANEPEIPRYDAGRGLLLRGDGKGQFKAVPGQESGIKVYGEQRGAAVADFDQDGRLDLVVTQNGASTRLYRNVRGKPGLRVRLLGPPGNPDGLGAQMRLFFGRRAGPVREIHAGSGYWSQDSTLTVLSLPQPASSIWVRWPGGKVTTSDIPVGSKEISVDLDGKLVLTR
jgi:hypothetical protein